MSLIVKTFIDASNYAIRKVEEIHETYKIYYRIKKGDYIAASPDSDMPDNSRYVGKFFWNGSRVQWVKAYGFNESSRMENLNSRRT